MPGGDDIYQTIGFILEAKDLASAIATKAQKILDGVASDMDNTLLGMTTTIEKVTAAGGEAAKKAADTVKTIGGKLIDLSGLSKTQAAARVDIARAAAEEQANMTKEARAELARAFADAAKGMDASLAEGDRLVQKGIEPIAASLKAVGGAFKNVFGELAVGPIRMFTDRVVGPMAVKVGEAADRVQASIASIPEKWQKTKEFFRQDVTFETLFDGAVAGAKQVAGAFSKVIQPAAGLLGKTLTGMAGTVQKGLVGGFKTLKTGAVFAGGAVNKVFQTALGLFKLGGGGGLFSALLGPLGPILTLLSPIINALTRAFAPAMETLEALMDAVFAPFAGILDTIMQSLMPVIQKALGPLVSLLELAAVQVGVLLQGLMDTSGAGSGFGAVIGKLVPVFAKVFAAMGDLAKRIFPIIIKLVTTLMPIVVRIIEIAGDAVAKILPILGNVIEKVFPQLIESVGKLLEALLPLLPPLLKLGVVLLEKVFAPLLVQTITLIADGLTILAQVLTEDILPVATEVIDSITESVTDFFDHFGKYMTDFYILFIKPVIDTVKDGVKTIYEVLGLEKVGTAIAGAFGAILNAVMTPLETLKGLINNYIIDPLNTLLKYDIPVVGKLGALISLPDGVPRLAEGGIAVGGGTGAIVGEAGPEMVLPLREDTVRTALQPILTDLSLPGLNEAVAGLERIERVLRGTLKVAVADDGGGGGGARAGGTSAADMRDLESAVGAGGFALGWEG